MTEQEITEAFQTVIRMDPRPADLAVLGTLGNEPMAVAEYLWDHMLGEPEEPTLVEVGDICERIAGIVTLKLTREQADDLWEAIDDERDISSDREDEDEIKWNDSMTVLTNLIHAAIEETKS